MQSIVELIAQIEKRPAMYLTKTYISCLKSYLDGWVSFAHNTECYDKIPDINEYNDFQQWIEEKYPISDSHSWANIILFFSSGETDALYNFFNLFNEWLNHSAKIEKRRAS